MHNKPNKNVNSTEEMYDASSGSMATETESGNETTNTVARDPYNDLTERHDRCPRLNT